MAASTRSSASSTPAKKHTLRASTSTTSSSTPSRSTTSLSKPSTVSEDTSSARLQPLRLRREGSEGHIVHATTASALYTAVLPMLCFFTFPELVADPITALQKTAGTLAFVEAVYMMHALPLAGSEEDPTSNKDKVGKRRKQNEQGGASYGERAIAILFSHTLTLLLTFPLIFLLTILLGAPLTSHLPQTALLCVLLALLTTPPLFYTRGVNPSAWREICSMTAPFDECFGGAVGALAGAWVGAVPIPLDWDREWQAWPVTIVVGAVGGWAVGRVMGGTWAWGKRCKWVE